MAGVLVLATPWSRRYFPADLRPDVEAAIPDGHVLTVGASRKPGEWTLVLYPPPTAEDVTARRHPPELHRTTVYGRDLPGLCLSTLRRWARAAA